MQDKPPACQGCQMESIGLGFVKPQTGKYGETGFRLGICAEAPGEDEVTHGVPLVGVSGAKLRRALVSAGIAQVCGRCPRDGICSQCYGASPHADVAIFNTIQCRPPRNDYSVVTRAAVEHCRQAHWPKPQTGAITVALGAKALEAWAPQLGGPGALERWRGSRIPSGDTWLVPTWHPAFGLRGSPWALVDMELDIKAAVQAVGWEYLLPQIVPVAELPLTQILAIDVEADEAGALGMIGLSTDGKHVAQVRADSWPAWLVEHALTIYGHNIKYDVGQLQGAGIDPHTRKWIDTMVAYRMYRSDARQVALDAAAAAVLTGRQLRWKPLGRPGAETEICKSMWLQGMPVEIGAYYDASAWFRLYNAIDVVNTWRLGETLRAAMERS